MARSEDILREIDEWVSDEEKIKTLTKETVVQMFDTWLNEFQVVQPSQFFVDHPTNDTDLTCSIQTELEFMLTTLEFFGLPKGYMDGKGHFPMWGKEKKDDKAAAARKRAAAKAKTQNKKAMERLKQKKKGTMQEDVKPTHFDITIFLKCFKQFIACNGDLRSNLRKALLKDINNTMKVFLDQHKEQSFKKCVDVQELAKLLGKNGFDLDQTLADNLGNILMCFGEIEHEQAYGERIPPETEEEKRARMVAEIKTREREEARKEAEENGEPFNEADFPIPVIEPKKPVLMLLHLISITDLKFCLQKMFEYDKALFQMGIQTTPTKEEQSFMSMMTKKFKKKFYDDETVHEMPEEPSKIYSEIAEIQAIAERIDDITSIPDPPENLKNAFSITLFCMEAAFDSRSMDFLKYAFEEYPDRDYLIITQPHTVVESQLISKFC